MGVTGNSDIVGVEIKVGLSWKISSNTPFGDT